MRPEMDHSQQCMFQHAFPARRHTVTLKSDLSVDGYHVFDMLKAIRRKYRTRPTHAIQLPHSLGTAADYGHGNRAGAAISGHGRMGSFTKRACKPESTEIEARLFSEEL